MRLDEGQVQVSDELDKEIAKWQRQECASCGQRSMLYCPFCCRALGVPAGVEVPSCRMPFRRCDVVFDDSAKKATSMHAKIIAPTQVRLIDLFTSDGSKNKTLSRHGTDAIEDAEATLREIPEYSPEAAVVLFPDEGSIPLKDIANVPGMVSMEKLTLILIDAPWRAAQTLRKHPHLAALRSVRLSNPPTSRFWRYHSEGAGCVSSIEALAAAAEEAEVTSSSPSANAVGEHPLLFFFIRQLALIASRSRPGAELPTDGAAKERRSARVRQKDNKAKRMRPMGADDVSQGVDLADRDG